MYGQVSFDPGYPTEPIEVFEPLVRLLFAEPRYLPPGWVCATAAAVLGL
jgi:hypothetical protein